MSLFSFEGKNVVITGAYSGMGRAAAEILQKQGAKVHVLDIREVEYPVASFHELDLRDTAGIARVAREVVDAVGGPIDILLNCAGLPHSSFPAPDIMQVNFFGLRQLTELLVEHMPDGSAIGHIASKSGIDWKDNLEAIQELLRLDPQDAPGWFASHPEYHDNAYGFSKACVIVYTMSRAVSLARRNIRMNAISPGATDTPMMEHFRKKRTDEQLRKSTGAIGRLSTPEEQAYPLIFLVSDEASYVSGINVVVDGAALGGFITGELEPPEVPQYARTENLASSS